MKGKPANPQDAAPLVTAISDDGIRLGIEGIGRFLPFDEFPWFRNVTGSQIRNVELVREGHVYWPDLDVDLSLEIIADPDQYPLVYR